jgi:hypothetical protein
LDGIEAHARRICAVSPNTSPLGKPAVARYTSIASACDFSQTFSFRKSFICPPSGHIDRMQQT